MTRAPDSADPANSANSADPADTAAQPETAQPATVLPTAARPETVQPTAVRPKTALPDTELPGTDLPDTDLPSTDERARAAILDHPAVVRVRVALAALGVRADIDVLDGAARTAAQAASYLGVQPAQIANSLLFASRAEPQSAPEPLLVLASGAHRVDTAKVADVLELAEVGRATPQFVRDTTGFVIGGVAPVGHLHPVRTVVDVTLARYATVWAAAGHPNAVFSTTYDELLRITGGVPIEAT